jgi:hypothetical protein
MAKPLETGKIYDLSRENGLSTVDSGARSSDGQCPGPGGVRPPSRWSAGGSGAVTVTGPGVTGGPTSHWHSGQPEHHDDSS